ncbi:MAG: hypothetical protein ACUZ77_09905, partial [Candidatus Brocadiales bacterium]
RLIATNETKNDIVSFKILYRQRAYQTFTQCDIVAIIASFNPVTLSAAKNIFEIFRFAQHNNGTHFNPHAINRIDLNSIIIYINFHGQINTRRSNSQS